MKKLYPLYFLSLLVLFFGSCSTKKIPQISENSSNSVDLSIKEDSLQQELHDSTLIDSTYQESLEEETHTSEDDDEMNFTVHDVQTAMAKLSPMYRMVFNLHVFDNLAHKEISDQLGISVGTSKSNLAKARRNLRKILVKMKNTDQVL